MINSRLKIANLLQFIILFGAPFIFLSIGKGFIVDEETMQDAQCMSFFDPTNCSAPLNGKLGMLFCPDVNLTSSCKEEFVAPDSESCNFLIGLLGYQETFKFDEISCDSVFMPPRNQQIYSSTVGSVENDFCSITITSCFDFDNDSNSSFQVCLMGAMSSFPYLPFQMKGASKYNDASKYSKCKSIPQLERIANIKENSDIDPPRNGIIKISIFVAGTVTTAAMLFVSVVFMPSVTLTTLKYRSGYLLTLRDENFQILRNRTQMVTYLIPAIFFSQTLMGTFGFLFFYGFTMFLLWKETREIVFQLLASIIAILITYVIRYVAMMQLETRQYDTFYRTKPGAANLTAIVFECWNTGTMVLAMLTRAAKLILVVLLFIGRVDRHFLANDLSKNDFYPYLVQKSILASDARE